MTRRAIPLTVILAIALSAALSACGFHLRGELDLAPALERTYINSVRPNRGVARQLEQLLVSAGAEVVPQQKQAETTVKITRDQFRHRVLAVDSDGRALELELRYEILATVSDAENRQLGDALKVSLIREILNDTSNVLATAEQANELRPEMARDIAGQLLRQLNARLR